jgi:hypothetical protein
MIRILSALIFRLFIVFAAVIVLIRAHPYSSGELRESFAPPAGCSVPCFMDVQPGVTAGAEARRRLVDHGWVEITQSFNSELTQFIYLQWRGDQYDWIDREKLASVKVEDGIIQSINIPTRISLGDVWLAFGKADWAFGVSYGTFEGVDHAIGYGEPALMFWWVVPYRGANKLERMLKANTVLSLVSTEPPLVLQNPSLYDILNGSARRSTDVE